jgi:hypothetical protein
MLKAPVSHMGNVPAEKQQPGVYTVQAVYECGGLRAVSEPLRVLLPTHEWIFTNRGDLVYEQIRLAIQAAAQDEQKMAMFHFQVLVNAPELQAANADEFCRAVSVPATYKTEFRKMLSLARLMREQGISLVRATH